MATRTNRTDERMGAWYEDPDSIDLVEWVGYKLAYAGQREGLYDIWSWVRRVRSDYWAGERSEAEWLAVEPILRVIAELYAADSPDWDERWRSPYENA